MQPRIEKTGEIKLIGKKINMSFANNQTGKLWQSFMPRRKEITNPKGSELYSVEVHNDPGFFKKFDPTKEFEKWAAIAVNDFSNVPTDMSTLTIPGGDYAVFLYKGKPSEAQATYQFIYAQWIPNSEYELDGRPHFALMGEKYKGEDPESEEEIWIPIRKK
jgi:AraC family transcriptional regulator